MGTAKICDCCRLPSTETDVASAFLTEDGILGEWPSKYGRAKPPSGIDLCVSCLFRLRKTWAEGRARKQENP